MVTVFAVLNNPTNPADAVTFSRVLQPAARALGLQEDIGTLQMGKYCDLAIWNIERPADLIYRMGFNPLHARIWRGQ